MLNTNGKPTRSLLELATELSEEQDSERLLRLVEELMIVLEAEDNKPRTTG